jgi:hypothetical protein
MYNPTLMHPCCFCCVPYWGLLRCFSAKSFSHLIRRYACLLLCYSISLVQINIFIPVFMVMKLRLCFSLSGGCRLFVLKHCSIYFGHHKAIVSDIINKSLEVPRSLKKLIPFLHIIIIPSGIKLLL